MASTLKQIKDLVKRETKTLNDPEITDLLLTRLANDAQRNIQLRLFHLGWKELMDTHSLTLGSGTYGASSVKTSNLSTDCPNRMGVPNWLIMIECSDGSVGGKGLAYPISFRVFEENILNSYLSPTLIKPVCTIIDDKIYIIPSTVTTATAHFYKEAADLSTDANTIDIPEAYATFIVQRMILEVQSIKGKLQDKQLAMAQLETEIGKAFEALQIQNVENKEAVSLQ